MTTFAAHFAATQVIVAALFAAAAGAAPLDTAGWVIRPGEAIGPIELGMSKEDVVAAIGDPERTNLGGWEYLSSGFAVLFGVDEMVSAVLAGGGTDQVRLDERFHARTVDGLGMGSTKHEILEALGEPDKLRSERQSEFLSYRNQGLEIAVDRGRVRWLALRRWCSD